ncbi:MAG: carboxypeptidase-like regulatory domain-containing protein [Bacteroidota bacterium]
MKKNHLPLVLTLLFLGFNVVSPAQQIITGTVTSDSVKVLAGVTVEILGTTIATLTDQEGRYTISAGDQATLVFRLQGYIPQEIPLNGRTQINVVLQRNRDSAAALQPGLLSLLKAPFHYCSLSHPGIPMKIKTSLPAMVKFD